MKAPPSSWSRPTESDDHQAKTSNAPQSSTNVTTGVFDVELCSPVIVVKRQLGNVVETREIIPGTMLFAALAGRLARSGVDIASAIQNRELVVTNATPVLDDQQTVPTPLSMSQTKGSTTELFNRCSGEDRQRLGFDQSRQLRGGYVTRTALGNIISYHAPGTDISLSTHSTIQDELQRPTSNVGGLYTYEAIAAGKVRRFEIRLAHPNAAEILDNLIPKNGLALRIGTSKKDDYGDVRIVPVKKAQMVGDCIVEPGASAIVTCTSDVVLINEKTLRPATSPQALAQAVAAAVGHPTGLQLNEEESTESYVRHIRYDGFHPTWVRSRPTIVAIQAGSVIQLKNVTAEPITVDERRLLLGIGERRAEGFGQIHFGGQFVSESLGGVSLVNAACVGTSTLASMGPQTRELNVDEREMIHRIFCGVWQQQIREEAATGEFLQNLPGTLTASQWGSIRQAAQFLGTFDEPSDDSPNAIQLLVQKIQGNSTRERRYRQLAETLSKLVSDVDEAWTLLGSAAWPALDDEHRVQLKNELWGFAVRQVLTAKALQADSKERAYLVLGGE